VYHLFVVRSGERDGLRRHLADAGIETLVHYPFSLPEQDAFSAYVTAACPIARAAAHDVLSLPLHGGLADSDVDRVADTVRSFRAAAGAA
jgi:dTDP-4-amino-4,6-dideoxygalactose transaminase